MKQNTLYVSDMDGTLLNSNSQLSSETIAILNRAIEHGALFTVATARTPATVVPLLSLLHTTLPSIVLNGAALWDHKAGDYAAVSTIQPGTLDAILAIYRRHGLCPLVYRRHGHLIHVHHQGELSVQEQPFVAERINLALKRFFLNEQPPIPGSDPCPDRAMLVFSMHRYCELEPVHDELLQSGILCSSVLYHDTYNEDVGLLEIYAPGVSKAHAITQLASQVGATRIVAFGDNLNDIPMLQVATVAVAVENAYAPVKAAAHQIIGPNTAHSVARFIEQDMRSQGL